MPVEPPAAALAASNRSTSPQGRSGLPQVKDSSRLGGAGANIGALALPRARPLEALASGHAGSLLTDPGGNVLKPSVAGEKFAYQSLQGDPVAAFCAKYRGPVRVMDREGEFLCLENLLKGFSSPHIMDCKMGCRTFLEKEVCGNNKLREDLYRKLEKLDPSLLTDEEKERKSITKFRYMTAREDRSSSKTLGFRIDGVAYPPPRCRLCNRSWARDNTLGSLREPSDIAAFFADFISRAAPGRARKAVKQLIQRLSDMQAALESSAFFRRHEMVGSSLLFAVDHSGRARVSIIDLAKVAALPDDLQINHTSEWQEGNHEDGYLMGLQNMERTWRQVEARLPEDGLNPRHAAAWAALALAAGYAAWMLFAGSAPAEGE